MCRMAMDTRQVENRALYAFLKLVCCCHFWLLLQFAFIFVGPYINARLLLKLHGCKINFSATRLSLRLWEPKWLYVTLIRFHF